MSQAYDYKPATFDINIGESSPRIDQNYSSISKLSNGGFVVSWREAYPNSSDISGYSSPGLQAQIFTAQGNPQGDVIDVSFNSPYYLIYAKPVVAGLSGGGFVVSWQAGDFGYTNDGDLTSISAQIYDSTGAKVGNEFTVNNIGAGRQRAPSIASLANGGFAVSWQDFSGQGGDRSLSGIKTQIFDAKGGKVGTEFLVNTTTRYEQNSTTISSLSDGGFVVSWVDESLQNGDLSASGIRAQVYNASGNKVGSEILVNTITSGRQDQPTITGLNRGGFVVSWTDASGLGGDNAPAGIKAQIFGADGVRVGGEFLVNTVTQGYQAQPKVAALSTGGFIVSWSGFDQEGSNPSSTGIKAQIFDDTGAKIGDEFLVNAGTQGDQFQSSVTGLSNGSFAVAWADKGGQGTSGAPTRIKVRVFSDGQTPPDGGQPSPSKIVGTTRDDVLYGTSGNDTIDGLAGADTMYGGQGDDTYIIEDLYEKVVEYTNGGSDTIIYKIFRENSIFSLRIPEYVENITAIGKGGYFLSGNNIDNKMIGGDASDYINGEDGADTMIGGLGNDIYKVDNSSDVVSELTGEGSDAIETTLSKYTLADNVEKLTYINTSTYLGPGTSNFVGLGNDLGNFITGGLRGDRLDGGVGADTLVGLLGNDTYVVDNAADIVVEKADEGIDRVLAQASYTLSDNVETLQLTTSAGLSGTGNDIANLILGNGGANVLDGRGGADTLTGGAKADTFVFRAGETVGDTVTDFVRGTDTLAFYGFGTDAVLSRGGGSDLYTVTNGDGLTSGSFRLTGVSDLDLSAGAANTDARFFA